MISFAGEPRLIPHKDGVHWTLENRFLVLDPKLGTIEIPAGFETDLGSIPRIFQNLISPAGLALRAYIGHDWLYAKQDKTRRQADDFLFRAMKSLGCPAIECWVVWTAVRLGGGIAWRSDTKKERRWR